MTTTTPRGDSSFNALTAQLGLGAHPKQMERQDNPAASDPVADGPLGAPGMDATSMERASQSGSIYDHGIKIEGGTMQLRMSLKLAAGVFGVLLLVLVVMGMLVDEGDEPAETITVTACDGEHCDLCLTETECTAVRWSIAPAGTAAGEVACKWNPMDVDYPKKHIHIARGCAPKPPPPPPPAPVSARGCLVSVCLSCATTSAAVPPDALTCLRCRSSCVAAADV